MYVKEFYSNFQFEPDVPVEIDESLFGKKVKHSQGNPGNMESKIWIVGKSQSLYKELIMYFKLKNIHKSKQLKYLV